MDNNGIIDMTKDEELERLRKIEENYLKYRKKKNVRYGISCAAAAVILSEVLSRLFSLFLSLSISLAQSYGFLSYLRFLSTNEGVLTVNIFYSILIMIPPFIFGFLISNLSLNETFLFKKTTFKAGVAFLGIGMGVAMLSNVASSLLGSIFSFLGSPVQGGSVEVADGFLGALLSVFTIGVIPALLEEFAYRGVVMGIVMKYSSKSAAIVISALLFGLMHGNFRQIPFAFVLGLFLAYSYAKTENLWVPIAIHFFNNTFSVFLDYTAKNFGTVGQSAISSAYYLICSLSALLGFVFLIKKDSSFPKLNEKPDDEADIKKSVLMNLFAPLNILAVSILLLSALYTQFSGVINAFLTEVFQL